MDEQPHAVSGEDPQPKASDAGAPIRVHDERNGATPANGYLRRSRAVRLLERVLASGALSAAQIADAIVVSEDELERYRVGDVRMPLARQLCLALVVIERVPALARHARALRGQVEAEAAFLSGETKTHSIAPVPHRWPS